MLTKNFFTKMWNNREKIITFCCFWGVLCYNLAVVCLSLLNMFTYNGGENDPKSYYEIKTTEMAQDVFLHEMIVSWLYGLLYIFPLIWSYFFTKRLNLNAVLVQLIPILTTLGIILFGN